MEENRAKGEGLKGVETKLAVGESACGLTRQADAVSDGKSLKLGFLEKNETGQNLSQDRKDQQAQELANTLNDLKDSDGKEILGHSVTAEEIKNLPSEIQKLVGPDGKFAGLYVNVLGQEGQNGEASALAMVTFLDYVKSHSGEPHDQLLEGACEQISKVLKAHDSQVDLAVALVDRNGEVTGISKGDCGIVIFQTNGAEKWAVRSITMGEPERGTSLQGKMQDGEKIVLCSNEAARRIKKEKLGGESVQNIVKALTSSENDRSAAAGSVEEKETAKPEETRVVVEELTPIGEFKILEHLPPFYADTANSISPEEFAKTYKKDLEILLGKWDEAKQQFGGNGLLDKAKHFRPIEKGEDEIAYEIRILDELKKRLGYPGDFSGMEKDELFDFVSGYKIPMGRGGFVLMAVEAASAMKMAEVNNQVTKKAEGKLGQSFRRAVKTEVSHITAQSYIEGPLENIYWSEEEIDNLTKTLKQRKIPEDKAKELAEKVGSISPFLSEAEVREQVKKGVLTEEQSKIWLEFRKKMPIKDIYAFTLIADQLLDANDPSLAKDKTYRELMREIQSAMEKEGISPQEKNALNTRLVDIRKRFYNMTIEALRTLHKPLDINLQSEVADDKVLLAMYSKLREISNQDDPISYLISEYKGVGVGEKGRVLTDRNKKRIEEALQALQKERQQLFDYALKGADLFRRRISYGAREVYKIPQKIYFKKLIQREEATREALETIGIPVEKEKEVVIKPPTQPPAGPKRLTPVPAVIKTPAGPENPPAAPVLEDLGPEGLRTTENEPLPPMPPGGRKGKDGQQPVVEVEAPQTIVLGAFADKGKHAVQQANEMGFAAEASFEELFRKRGLLGGKVAGTDRVANGLARAGFEIKKRVPIPVVRTVLSLPFTVASNTLRIARHPVKYLVRGMFKPFFDNQNFRFGADVQGIVQKQAKLDPSIPVDIPDDLPYLALKKGSERRNKGFFRKIKNNFVDLLSDLSLGHRQTSEQREGRKWLEEQLGLDEDQRDSELKSLWQTVNERSLVEQDAEGQRFAYLGYNNLDEMKAAGLSLDDVNRRVLAQGERETRYSLQEVDAVLYGEANDKLKGFIKTYIENVDAGGDAETLKKKLLEDVNKYLTGKDFRDRLSEQYKKEFSGFQVANNIISLADKVAAVWTDQGYLKKDESDQTAWDKTKIEILFGGGEWHGRRGNREYGKFEGLFGLQEKINQEIVKQKLGLRESSYQEGASIARKVGTSLGLFAKEVGVYGIAAFLGMKASALVYAPSTALSFVGVTGLGATTGVGALAALRERGVDIPWLTDKTGFRLRGRLELDRDRLSREMALRRSGEQRAIVRKELEDALVKPVAAADLTSAIEAVIGGDRKGELDSQKAEQLLLALAEADARLGMTDRSGRKEMKFRVQNFVSYTEGKQGEEYLKLHKALLDGQRLLMDYLIENPQAVQKVLPGQTISDFTEFSQAFEKTSALAKAQLIYGSEGKAAKRIEGWLRKEGQQFDIDEGEVPALMKDLFPKLDLEIAKEESLKRKDRNWFFIRNTRAYETFLTVVAGGLTTGQVIKAEIGEVKNLWGDIQHAHGIGGVGEYVREWGDVLFKGDVPLELNPAGQLVADASLGQKGVLLAHSFFEKPPWSLAHQEMIDGIQFELPGGLRYREVGDLNGDGVTERAIVDVPNGRVAVDMSNYHLERGVDASGNPIVYATGGMTGSFNAQLAKAGILVHRGPDVPGTAKTIEITPRGVDQIKNPVSGELMDVPKGTLDNGHQWQAQWVADGKNWDLKVVDMTDPKHPFVQYQGHDAILIDNAHVAGGKMVYDSASSLGLMKETPTSTTSISEVKILTPDGKVDPNGELGKNMGEMPTRNWHTEHQLQLYNFKNEQGNVVLDFRKSGGDSVFVSFGGDSRHGFRLPDEIDGRIDGMVELNPNSTVVIPGSHGFTLGQLTQTIINEDRLNGHGMPAFVSNSEYHNMPDLFKLGVGGKQGYIEACDSSGNIFATIRGTTSVPQSIEVPGVTETISQVVTANVIKDVVPSVTSTFTMSAPPIDFGHLWLIPIPMRRPLEPSVAEGKVEQPAEKQTKVTTPSDQKPPITPPPAFTEERKRQLEQEQEQILSKPEDERSDEDKQRLEEINQELAEFEAALELPEEEGSTIEVGGLRWTAKKYRDFMEEGESKVEDGDLDEVNHWLEDYGLTPINEEKLNELKANQKNIKPFLISDVFLEIIKKEAKESDLNDEQIAQELEKAKAQIAAWEGEEEEGEESEEEKEYKNMSVDLNKLFEEKTVEELTKILGIEETTAKELKDNKEKRKEFIKKFYAEKKASNEVLFELIDGMTEQEREKLVKEAESRLSEEEREIIKLIEPLAKTQMELIAASRARRFKTIEEMNQAIAAIEEKIAEIPDYKKKVNIYVEALDKREAIINQLILQRPAVKKIVEERAAQIEAQIEAWEVEAEAGIEVPETKENADEAKREIFERAGKRTADEVIKTIDEILGILEDEKNRGAGKLKSTIEKMRNAGVKEIIHDEGIVYIPQEKGELVVFGDLHGDFDTLKKVIEGRKFIENMEIGDKSMTLVLLGDIVDRGSKQSEIMEALLELKKRYPNNIVIMKADHEVGSKDRHLPSPHDLPFRLQEHYYPNEPTTGKPPIYLKYTDLFHNLPRITVCGNGAVLVHGGPPVPILNLEHLKDQYQIFEEIVTWSDPISEKAFEAYHKRFLDADLSLLDQAIKNAEQSPTKTGQYKGKSYNIDDLRGYKQGTENKLKLRIKDNLDRGIGYYYTRTTLEQFLQAIGAQFMIRAHEEEDRNPIGDDIFATIHTTGFPGNYAVFDKSSIITRIDPTKNILKVD